MAGVAVDGDVVGAVVKVVKVVRTYPGNARSEGIGYLSLADHPSAGDSFSGPVDVPSFAEDGRMVSATEMLLL